MYEEEEQDGQERPRDNKIDEAVEVLRRLFQEQPDRVFYGRQLEVMLEKEFFHWITKKAAGEMAARGEIRRAEKETPRYTLHFYWSRKLRYAQRAMTEIEGLVAEFSDPEFTRALGAHGETMAEVAFGRRGFKLSEQMTASGRRILGVNVREWNGRRWNRTEKNLDRVFGRDGIEYGCEVKNSLGYIERDELEEKLAMCEYLGLVPLLVARQIPASYLNMLNDAGGFGLVLEYQIYPLGFGGLAKRVKASLGFPVDAREAWFDSTLNRFENWHARKVMLM